MDTIHQIFMIVTPLCGFFAHWRFLKFVWNKVDGYCRAINVLISFSMSLVLFVFLIKQVMDFFGTSPKFRLYSSYALGYGQCLLIFTQFTFSLDRLLNVQAKKFTTSLKYLSVFVCWNIFLHIISIVYAKQNAKENGLAIPSTLWISLTLALIFSCIPLDILTVLLYKSRYESTKGHDLNRRFEIAMSYELSRCFVYSSIINASFIMFQLAFLALMLTGIIALPMLAVSTMARMVQCIEFSIFPLIVVCNHRSSRRNSKYFGKMARRDHKNGQKTNGQVYSLYGQRLKNFENQFDHFVTLRYAWS